MRKSLLLLLIGLTQSMLTWASHLRGGEITAQRIPGNGYTYKFTINTYRDTRSAVEDTQLTIDYGDGSAGDTQPYTSATDIPGSETKHYVYEYIHTYASPGQYAVSVHIDFRNSTVVNLGGNSGAIKFYVETQITISPTIDQTGFNNSPVLYSFAVDIAAVRQVYVFNPAAFDPDGDSLSYELAPSRTYIEGIGPSDISGYKYPNDQFPGLDSTGLQPAIMTVDAHTGLLRWDVPAREGEYNVAIIISEWRFGRRIGYVTRDMQIIVRDVLNKRPLLHIPQDTCVLANSNLDKNVTATDPDATDKLAITATGGLFFLTPTIRAATISPASAGPDGLPIYQNNPARTRFRWNPGCEQVRIQPYDATFKVVDRPINVSDVRAPLVDVKTWSIKVIGPPPQLDSATPGLGSVTLNWSSYICNNIEAFYIYRRVDSSTFRPDTCTVGVPPEEGFTLIGSTDPATTTYLDDNDGRGLKRNARYCYRITAKFAGINGGESKESAQVCAQLLLDVPLLTNVTIQKTDSLHGIVDVKWTRPKDLNLVRFPGPYRYQLKRSLDGLNFGTIQSTTNLNDTAFTDTAVNTAQTRITYRVVFNYQDNTGKFYKDSADDAQDIILNGQSNGRAIALTWTAQVPWDNAPLYHYVYKEVNNDFIFLDSVPGTSPTYYDNGKPDPLVVNQYYRYKVETKGLYHLEGIASPLRNLSYIISVRHRDTIPPCPPQTLALANPQLECPSCEDLVAHPDRKNVLTWHAPRRDSCALDLAYYKIYFRPHRNGNWTVVGTTTDTTFSHSDNGSLAGCYKVTAVDSSNNEDTAVATTCNDNCVGVDLPNLITKNSDGFNDFWRPICITQGLIDEAELVIYNRWGREVYKSAATDIRWPGPGENSQKIEPGTYYYHLKVRGKRLDEPAPFQSFKGWIEVNSLQP